MQPGKTKFPLPKPANGINREISSMFAAPSEERSHDGASHTCGENITKPRSKVKKKATSPKVTLPPLCREPPSLSAAFVARPLFNCTPVLRNVPFDRPLSVVELPHLIAHVGPGKAADDTKWTEGPRLMASALGTHIPIRTADESTAQRYIKNNYRDLILLYLIVLMMIMVCNWSRCVFMAFDTMFSLPHSIFFHLPKCHKELTTCAV